MRRRALHFQLLLFAVDDIAEVGAADDLLHVLSLVSPEDLKELAVRGDELVAAHSKLLEILRGHEGEDVEEIVRGTYFGDIIHGEEK